MNWYIVGYYVLILIVSEVVIGETTKNLGRLEAIYCIGSSNRSVASFGVASIIAIVLILIVSEVVIGAILGPRRRRNTSVLILIVSEVVIGASGLLLPKSVLTSLNPYCIGSSNRR